MRTLRSAPFLVVGALGLSLALGSCTSSAPEGSSSPEAGASAEATSGSGAAEPYRISRAAITSATDDAVADVGPRKGATLTVTLPSGAVATLVVEAEAVETRTTLKMIGFTVDGTEGVLLEPAGTWLDVPGRLSFTNTTKSPAVRVGSADGLIAFAPPALAADGSVIVVRLRPVVLLGDDVAALPAAPPAADPGTPPVVPEDDPLDKKAADEEGGEAADPDGQSDSQETKDDARRVVTQVAAECGPDVPEAAGRALEAWRTAGSVGAPPVECAVLRAAVLAQTIIEFTGAPLKPYQETVRATGSGRAIDRVADFAMPAEREVSGIEQLISFMATGVEWGVAKVVGKDWPDPNVNRCTLGQIPQGSVQLETVPLPNGKLRVTLTPRHGAYPVDCGEWGVLDMDVTVWDNLGDLLGIKEGGPFVVTTTSTEHVQHVMSSLKSVEGMTVRHRADGSVTVREGGLVMNGVLDLDLSYEPAT